MSIRMQACRRYMIFSDDHIPYLRHACILIEIYFLPIFSACGTIKNNRYNTCQFKVLEASGVLLLDAYLQILQGRQQQ